MNPPNSADSLMIALRSRDDRDRLAILARLREQPETSMRAEAWEALIENLGAENKHLRRQAAIVLASAGGRNRAILARLMEALEAPEARIRWAAVYTLGLIGDALDLRAGDVLVEALGDSDGDIRWAALDLMVRLGRRYPDAIRNRLLAIQSCPDANRRKMSLYAMRELGLRDAAVMAAVDAACAAPHRHVRLAALSVLRRSGRAEPMAVDIALRCLKSDPDSGVRRAAAGTLGYLDDRSRRVLAALREAADAPDAALRKAALQTLARLKEEP